MENKKPKSGRGTGFHGNQYVDSQGRRRNPTGGAAHKTDGKHKTGPDTKTK